MQKHKNKASVKYQIKSFRWAINGLSDFLRSETKSKIHILSGIVVIALGAYFRISQVEWISIAVAIGIVLISEIINTAIERIADCIPDKYDKERGRIKDLAAAAVLISSLLALSIAILIFIPKLVKL